MAEGMHNGANGAEFFDHFRVDPMLVSAFFQLLAATYARALRNLIRTTSLALS